MKIGIDTETDGLSFFGKVASVQFYFPNTGQATYPVNMVGLPDNERAKNLLAIKRHVEENKLVSHNMLFDLLQLYKLFGTDLDVDIEGDSYLFALMTQQAKKGLKDLVVKYGIATEDEVVKFSTVVPDHNSTAVRYDDSDFLKYAGNDPEWAFKLEEEFRLRFPSYIKVYEREITYIKAFVKMSFNGLNIDWEGFVKYRDQYRADSFKKKKDLNDLAGWDFRPKSRADLMKILFDERKLNEPPVKTKNGAVSVSLEALQYLKGDPFVDKLIEYLSRFSVENTMNSIEKYLPDSFDGTKVKYPDLHPTFKIVGEDGTSRVYTQAPSANSLPKEFRNFIVPSPGCKFIYWDLSAAELILAAYWANEEWLTKAYENGEDIHKLISSKLLDKDISTLTGEDRKVSKIVTFSVLYGSEGHAASRALKIEVEEAARLISKFWQICPKIAELKDWLIDQAFKTGATMTIIKRRRSLPKLYSENQDEKKKEIRKVFNTAVQGSVADIQKEMIRAIDESIGDRFGGRIVFTVFDSFLVEVPKSVSLEEFKKYSSIFNALNMGSVDLTFNAEYKEGMTFLEAAI